MARIRASTKPKPPPARSSPTCRPAAGPLSLLPPVVGDNEGMAGDGAGTVPGTGQERPRPRARELNELIRYTMWSVFRVRDAGALDAA